MIRKEALIIGIITWVVVTLLFSKFDATVGGVSRIGFPWHFYSYSNTPSYLTIETNLGFNFNNFVLDIFCGAGLIIGIDKFFSRNLKVKQTNSKL